MVTADEIAAVTVFEGLDLEARERLSRAAADITLEHGEYAANLGDDRALFAVLEGRIEPVNIVDGIERVVGVRNPGEVFGEVPIVLGSPFPVGFRAAERSRVMRLDPQDYHALAAVEPEIARRLGELSSKRIAGRGGLQGLAADPPPPRAVVVGHRWDAACADLRLFLDRNQITFVWVTPDAPDAAETWGGTLPAGEDLPSIRVIDGKTVRRPRPREVAELLGLGTEPAAPEYDTVVVGARPASPPPSTGPPRGCGRSSSSARRQGGRPAPRRASRTTSASPRGCRAASWRAARSSRRAGSGPRSS